MSETWFQQLSTRMKRRGINFASFPFVGITVGLGIGLSGAILWHIPVWSVPRADLSYKEHLELIDKYRGTLAQIFAGLGIAAGLIFTWKNLTVAREGQITERFTRAIDQLGSRRLEIRLGGIYALERIARDSAKDHWPIMEVLTAYVREHAASAAPTLETTSQPPGRIPVLASDIQAILTVLGRRSRWYEKDEDKRLDLRQTNLCKADLRGAHLEGMILANAYLEAADLMGAHLEKADLWCTRLDNAHMEGAFLEGAHPNGTHIEGANLRGAHGLTREQITQRLYITDNRTQLPAYLTTPP